MSICNKCKSQNISQLSDVEKNTYKDSVYYVDIDYSVCNQCQREFLSKAQILANEIKVREAKKGIEGLLSAKEIKNIRKYLNLSQANASKVFGGGVNAFSKYERSEVTQSRSMDKLLRLAGSDRYVFRKLLDLSGVKVEFQFVSSIDIADLSSQSNVEWTNSQFDMTSTTQEIDTPELKLAA